MNEPGESGQPRSIHVTRPSEPAPADSRPPSTQIDLIGAARPPATRPPLIDIHETADGLVLEADLPGTSDRTLTIQLQDNLLHLRATLDLHPPPEARIIQQEFAAVGFERTFILSDEVDRSQIAAELKNGVLRIVLPRAERGRARRIDVRSE